MALRGFTCSLFFSQQSLPKLPADKSRSKRSKEPKPRVKKLKYHQYIPPDQKQELNEVPMDSAYARLLQQQQQFLQLQILSQQQQQYSYQPVPPATVKYGRFSSKVLLLKELYTQFLLLGCRTNKFCDVQNERHHDF